MTTYVSIATILYFKEHTLKRFNCQFLTQSCVGKCYFCPLLRPVCLESSSKSQSRSHRLKCKVNLCLVWLLNQSVIVANPVWSVYAKKKSQNLASARSAELRCFLTSLCFFVPRSQLLYLGVNMLRSGTTKQACQQRSTEENLFSVQYVMSSNVPLFYLCTLDVFSSRICLQLTSLLFVLALINKHMYNQKGTHVLVYKFH